MNPYSCLATGKDVGLIEIVKQAKTITAIQSRGGARAAIQMDSSQLHKWIKEKNTERSVCLFSALYVSEFMFVERR
jgi:phosphatidylinositol-4,5-bisphosphate 3-kinase